MSAPFGNKNCVGRIPWNKGKKGYKIKIKINRKGKHYSPKTEFKKGLIPWNKGIPHSEDTKLKISKKVKGNKHSEKANLEKSLRMRGKKQALGYKHTKEWKLKRSLEMMNGGPNWQGGITKLSFKIRNSFKYRQWKSDIFTRDNFTCQECGIKGGKLHAHHIKQFAKIIEENQIKTLEQALICEELWNLNNGITLCINCHKKTDTYLKK